MDEQQHLVERTISYTAGSISLKQSPTGHRGIRGKTVRVRPQFVSPDPRCARAPVRELAEVSPAKLHRRGAKLRMHSAVVLGWSDLRGNAGPLRRGLGMVLGTPAVARWDGRGMVHSAVAWSLRRGNGP